MIRKIISEDIPALFKLRVQTRENEITLEELTELGITPDTIEAGLSSTLNGWLCEIDGEIVGFAMGNAANGEMTVIALLPAYEKRGIGKQVLTQVESWLFSKGWEKIWLTTDIDTSRRAYGFYLKQGWQDDKIANGDRYMIKVASSE